MRHQHRPTSHPPCLAVAPREDPDVDRVELLRRLRIAWIAGHDGQSQQRNRELLAWSLSGAPLAAVVGSRVRNRLRRWRRLRLRHDLPDVRLLRRLLDIAPVLAFASVTGQMPLRGSLPSTHEAQVLL